MRGDMMRGGGTKEEATSILTRKIAAEITIGNTIDNTTIEMSIEGITIERKIEDITQEGIETNLLTETSAQNNSTEVTRKDTTHRTNTKKIQPTDPHPANFHPKDQLPLTEPSKNLTDLPTKIRDRPPHPDSTTIFPITTISDVDCSKIVRINSDILSFWVVTVGKGNFGVF